MAVNAADHQSPIGKEGKCLLEAPVIECVGVTDAQLERICITAQEFLWHICIKHEVKQQKFIVGKRCLTGAVR